MRSKSKGYWHEHSFFLQFRRLWLKRAWLGEFFESGAHPCRNANHRSPHAKEGFTLVEESARGPVVAFCLLRRRD